jgi:hypothetical protein
MSLRKGSRRHNVAGRVFVVSMLSMSGAGAYMAFVDPKGDVINLRMIRRGGVIGAQRLTRHLWRMCTGLFIAVGSFFLGQPQVFPVAVRNSGLLVVPTLLVIVSLGYWLFRVNAFQRRTAAAKAQHIMSEAVAR